MTLFGYTVLNFHSCILFFDYLGAWFLGSTFIESPGILKTSRKHYIFSNVAKIMFIDVKKD